METLPQRLSTETFRKLLRNLSNGPDMMTVTAAAEIMRSGLRILSITLNMNGKTAAKALT